MDQETTRSIAVTSLRAIDLSPDGKEITICLSTRYSTAERFYYVPIECFYDLIVDLRRLNASTRPEAPEVSEVAIYGGEATE